MGIFTISVIGVGILPNFPNKNLTLSDQCTSQCSPYIQPCSSCTRQCSYIHENIFCIHAHPLRVDNQSHMYKDTFPVYTSTPYVQTTKLFVYENSLSSCIQLFSPCRQAPFSCRQHVSHVQRYPPRVYNHPLPKEKNTTLQFLTKV